MTNLATVLADSAARYPDRVAIKLDELELSYALLDQGSQRVAAVLAGMGVRAGDRIGLMMPNLPYFPVIFYGALRLGAVVVPMNPLLKEREVRFYLENSGAKVLFALQMFETEAKPGAEAAGAEYVSVDPASFGSLLAGAEPLDGVADRAGDDTAVILYTSGTTGTPKGAELTHDNLLRNVEVAVSLFDPRAEDVMFGGLPLFHVFGLTCGLNACISVGGCMTLLPRFDAGKALEILERDKVTIFEGVPTMYAALLNEPDRDRHDISALRLCCSGGAALPVELLQQFEQAFGCTVLEGYGLSETSPVASFNRPDRRRPGSIGVPADGVEMRIVGDDGAELPAGEVGEIAIRGHNVMKGYWNRPEATADAIDDEGWFRSGDLGRIDDDGFFFVVDRKKEMLIRGGYNVYPREIEEVLYEHVAVAEAAVIGLPHPGLGEEVAAAVALKPGSEVTADQIRAFVKERVAAYKYPRHVWIVDALPKGATGKILKREIAIPERIGAPA
jgi:long-chain acyl-CoA synthetase